MTEGQYQALRDEIARAAHDTGMCMRMYGDADFVIADAVMPVVARELAARDEVIQQIRALAEEWRAVGVGKPGDSPLDTDVRIVYGMHGNEIQRLLSSLPSTNPGDGRVGCATCGKWVHLITHSCKGVPVTPAAKARAAQVSSLPSTGETNDG